ncbi:hypothetical protein GCM10009830_45800 [Glycomyces endophyticus]|uniref:Cyclic nucleotide-binding domain-containing protein n=1 Tax=Glycomyces endophyticus TaxID=480996 RepID=A0ABN2HTC6_9ACTN
MNGDIEALLRSGLAEQAERAPATVDDPALADLAIAGAHRIRRRRRVAAAAGGTGLLVLGAGAFVLQPLLDGQDQGPSAADTSTTTEARNELGMEFLVEGVDGYEVLNEDGDTVMLASYAPEDVFRLADGYMVVSSEEQTTEVVSLDGGSSFGMTWPSENTYNLVNTAATQFAMVTPNAEVTAESYAISSAVIADQTSTVEFTTSYDLTLSDWSDTTTVFSADLWSTTAGEENNWYFDEEYDWNLQSVGVAGYESAVFVDQSNPSYVCVADLSPGVGVAKNTEDCGEFDSSYVQESLKAASADDAAADLVGAAVDKAAGMTVLAEASPQDLGDHEDRYYQSDYIQYDPYGRWEVGYSRGDETWVLIDYTEDPPVVSSLTPPEGAVMPVLDYRPPE